MDTFHPELFKGENQLITSDEQKLNKEPSINNVGNFSGFLTPNSPMSAVFKYYPLAILTTF